MPKSHAPRQIYIFIANNFDEASVISCFCRLRAEGFRVSLVSQTSGLVNGLHGLAVRPDCYLARLEAGDVPDLVIVAGGDACAAQLLADPRIFSLLQEVMKQERMVALLSAAAYDLLTSLNISPSLQGSTLFVLEYQNQEKFIENLVQQIVV